MLSGQYFTDMITLNILADGNEKIELDDEGNLNVNGEINISDGQHRIRALAMILESNDKGNTDFDLTELKFPVKSPIMMCRLPSSNFINSPKGLKLVPAVLSISIRLVLQTL